MEEEETTSFESQEEENESQVEVDAVRTPRHVELLRDELLPE